MKVCLNCGARMHDMAPACTDCGRQEFSALDALPPDFRFPAPNEGPTPVRHAVAGCIGTVAGVAFFIALVASGIANGGYAGVDVAFSIAVGSGVYWVLKNLLGPRRPSGGGTPEDPIAGGFPDSEILVTVKGPGAPDEHREVARHVVRRALLVRETGGALNHYFLEVEENGEVLHFDGSRLRTAAGVDDPATIFPCTAFTLLDMGSRLAVRCEGPRLEPKIA